MQDKVFSTTSEMAAMFGLSEAYLRKLRSLQAGPVYSKIGRMVRYRVSDVQAWLADAAVEVTPERAV